MGNHFDLDAFKKEHPNMENLTLDELQKASGGAIIDMKCAKCGRVLQPDDKLTGYCCPKCGGNLYMTPGY